MRLHDPAVFADDVCDAPRVLVLWRLGGAIGDPDLPAGIADQREREVELFGEALVLFPSVEADAEDPGVFRFVLVDEVPEPGTLKRSARCVGLRIEPQNDLPAAQVPEPDGLAAMVGGLEIGGKISNIQHACSAKD